MTYYYLLVEGYDNPLVNITDSYEDAESLMNCYKGRNSGNKYWIESKEIDNGIIYDYEWFETP